MAASMAMDMPPDHSSWASLSPMAVLTGIGTAVGTIATAFFAFAGRRVDGRNVAQALSNDAQKTADGLLVKVAEGAVLEIAGLKAERAALEVNVREGWDRGRGMEEQTHWFSHKLRGLVFKHNGLLQIIDRFITDTVDSGQRFSLPDGWIAIEVAQLDRFKKQRNAFPLEKEPPDVKRLSDVEKRGPP